MSINRVVISGNLTRDGELRQTAGGTPVLGLGVAVTDRRRNAQTGEWEDVPNFVDCTMFGARAEGIARYLLKGTKVCIEGKLRWSQWEKDGQRRSKLEVVVDEIEFSNPNRQPQQQYAPQPMAQQYQQPQGQMNMYAPQGGSQQYMPQYAQQAIDAMQGVSDSDIPF